MELFSNNKEKQQSNFENITSGMTRSKRTLSDQLERTESTQLPDDLQSGFPKGDTVIILVI